MTPNPWQRRVVRRTHSVSSCPESARPAAQAEAAPEERPGSVAEENSTAPPEDKPASVADDGNRLSAQADLPPAGLQANRQLIGTVMSHCQVLGQVSLLLPAVPMIWRWLMVPVHNQVALATMDPGNLLWLTRLSGLRSPSILATSNVGIASLIQRQGAETSQPGS